MFDFMLLYCSGIQFNELAQYILLIDVAFLQNGDREEIHTKYFHCFSFCRPWKRFLFCCCCYCLLLVIAMCSVFFEIFRFLLVSWNCVKTLYFTFIHIFELFRWMVLNPLCALESLGQFLKQAGVCLSFTQKSV